MALSWKLLNALDKEQVDKLAATVENIRKNHEQIAELKASELSEAEEAELAAIVKNHKKALDQAIEVLAAFDQELDAFAQRAESK